MYIKNRVEMFCSLMGISVHRFEIESGLSKSYVRKLKKSVGLEKRKSIEKAFPQLNIDWVLTGRGEMITSEYKDMYPDVMVALGNQIGGENNNNSITNNYNGCCSYNQSSLVNPNLSDVAWVNVSSLSLVSEIRMGDVVAIRDVVDWKDFLLKGRIYFVTMNNGTRLFCKLVPAENEKSLRLSGDIETDEDQEVSKDKIKCISEVIAVTKML